MLLVGQGCHWCQCKMTQGPGLERFRESQMRPVSSGVPAVGAVRIQTFIHDCDC